VKSTAGEHGSAEGRGSARAGYPWSAHEAGEFLAKANGELGSPSPSVLMFYYGHVNLSAAAGEFYVLVLQFEPTRQAFLPEVAVAL
jgi:hypothetical protein